MSKLDRFSGYKPEESPISSINLDSKKMVDHLAGINSDLARIKELVREREMRFRRPVAQLARIVRN